MLPSLILLVPIAILSFLLWHQGKDRISEREAWRKERSELLTRIQAPELAPSIDAPEPSEVPLYVPENDAAWLDYQEARAKGEAV